MPNVSAFRIILLAERAKADKVAKQGAYTFLVFGEDDEHLPAPDGRPWNRNYDPAPTVDGRKEAMPGSTSLPTDDYIGTGIGLLYGLDDGESDFVAVYEDEFGMFEVAKNAYGHLAWQLAGWNLPTTSLDKSAFKKERNGG